MIAATILSSILAVAGQTQMPSKACSYIIAWRGTNVPIAPPTAATDIVHAVAVSKGGESIGWFVIRRDGQMWYFDGPVRGPKPSADMSAELLQIIGKPAALPDAGHGEMLVLKKPVDLRSIVRNNFKLESCY